MLIKDCASMCVEKPVNRMSSEIMVKKCTNGIQLVQDQDDKSRIPDNTVNYFKVLKVNVWLGFVQNRKIWKEYVVEKSKTFSQCSFSILIREEEGILSYVITNDHMHHIPE